MIDKYRQAFQEEARELVAELESALLELDQKPDDCEIVGRAFRALHTIKGSGAMFGFDEVAGFAHNLETAFDRLRTGQLTATADLINLTLAAGDQIRSMLDEADGRGTVDQARSCDILAELQQLTRASDPLMKMPSVQAAQNTAAGTLVQGWHIRFRPGPDVLLHGTNPIFLIAELRQLGPLQVLPDMAGVPPLGEIDPERCYLAWDMVLKTAATRDEIRDVFIFVEDDCELTIECGEGRPAETIPTRTAPPRSGPPKGEGRLVR